MRGRFIAAVVFLVACLLAGSAWSQAPGLTIKLKASEAAGAADAGDGQVRFRIKGVDVFHPQTGEIESSGPDGIACWFLDTDYNEESFFVRHAYFLGASDSYKVLKTTLKAETDDEAWQSLHRDVSRPFDKPKSGRIAVKVINHLGDEVMKVFATQPTFRPHRENIFR